MSDFISALAAFIFGIKATVTPTPSNSPVNSTVCFNQEMVKKGISPADTRVPAELTNIIKPSRNNTTTGYEIDRCLTRGGCSGPEAADYILVAKNIKIDKTSFPNSFIDNTLLSDRQLVKQTDFTLDPILADRYKNRIYRTHCGDWCYTCEPEDVRCLDENCLRVECNTDKPAVELPFRGSFHCDFIFYLQDYDDKGKPQIDDAGASPVNPSDPTIPRDGGLFSVYMRQDAPLPKYIECNDNNPESTYEQLRITPFYSINQFGLTSVEYPQGSGSRWKLAKNASSGDGSFSARNSQILSSVRLLGTGLRNPVGLTGSYNLYQNLLDPQGMTFLYLVSPDTVENMRQLLYQNSRNIQYFTYYLLLSYDITHAKDPSLKLATFPFSNDWIKKWVYESKPAIYIYPQKEEKNVTVKLSPKGTLAVSDPPYDPESGWNVNVYPDGTIQCNNETMQQCNNEKYSYLFYEANLEYSPDPKTGFVIARENLSTFLKSAVTLAGLNEKETKDYLEYWIPKLSGLPQPYIMVHFLSGEEIEFIEPLEISLRVNTAVRLRTYFKPLTSPLTLSEQRLRKDIVRKGNVLVEWGGILDSN